MWPVPREIPAFSRDSGDSRVRPLARVSSWARQIFSFPVFLAVVIVGGAFIASSWNGIALGKILTEGDVWWHLATGERILATHTFPVTDSYSYTAVGTPWIAYGWLPEVLMAISVRLHGLQGLAFLLLLSAASFYLLLYYYAWLRSRSAKAAAIACAAVLPLTGVFVSPRPQFLAAILFVIVLICIEHFRQGKQKALWCVPPAFLLWVNTHGSFILGLALLGLCWIETALPIPDKRLLTPSPVSGQSRRFGSVFFASLVAVCITPYGTRLATYPFEFGLFQRDLNTIVTEWQPPNLHQAYTWAFVAIVLGIVFLQVLRPLKYRLAELVFLAFCALYGCLHARFLLIFGLAVVPIIADSIHRFVPAYDAQKDKPGLNAILIALILAGLLALFPSQQQLNGALASRYPERALRYLEEHPPAHLWNEDTWGSYLIWAGKGRIKVFIDGRFDIYDYTGVLSDYVAVMRSEPASERLILSKYQIDTVLLHGDAPLAASLAHSANWQSVYQDDVAVVFRRVAARPN